MTLFSSEAVVLRTWPVQESDLIVSFLTRDYGKIKGLAKAALKSRKRFGGALEPMTVARAYFADRPRQELARLDQLEILRSPLSTPVDYARAAVLSFFAETLDECLQEQDAQEAIFRLALAVLEQTTVEQPWMPATYFSLWLTRLMGWLPDLAHCTVCRRVLLPGEVRFHQAADGLFCPLHGPARAGLLSGDSWTVAQRMMRSPVSSFAAEDWPRGRGRDLRRFLWQSLERHLERKLRSVEALSRLGG